MEETKRIYNGLGGLIDDPSNNRIAVTLAYNCGKMFNTLHEKRGKKLRVTLHRIFLAALNRDVNDLVLCYEEFEPTFMRHASLQAEADVEYDPLTGLPKD